MEKKEKNINTHCQDDISTNAPPFKNSEWEIEREREE